MFLLVLKNYSVNTRPFSHSITVLDICNFSQSLSLCVVVIQGSQRETSIANIASIGIVIALSRYPMVNHVSGNNKMEVLKKCI